MPSVFRVRASKWILDGTKRLPLALVYFLEKHYELSEGVIHAIERTVDLAGYLGKFLEMRQNWHFWVNVEGI